MRVAWIDCSGGASGDMLLGAFLDAGADREQVNAAVAAVDDSLSVTVERTSRHQIAATKASVRVNGELHPEEVAATADAHDHGHGHGHGQAGDAEHAGGGRSRNLAE